MNSLISPIILLIASTGLFFAFINPQYQASQQSNITISNLSQVAQQAGDLDAAEQKVRNNYNAITTDQTDQLEKLLPDSVDTIRLTTDISGIAAGHGITVKQISIAKNTADSQDEGGAVISSDSKHYGSLLLSFSVSASYTDFLAFLKDLEHSLRIIDVNSISIGGVPDKGAYGYSITAQTYWLK